MPRGRALIPALGVAALACATPVFASRIVGTSGPDHLVGTAGADVIKGRGGADRIAGRGGADRLKGNRRDDRIAAGRGADLLQGGRGHDRLLGGKGDDLILAGDGRDEINMRAGVRKPSPGDDVIRVRDRTRDEINCGSGHDVVYVDAVEDGVYDCEVVVER